MNFMNISYNPNNWRLLIDTSKLSLKAVLLHNGNLIPSIPIGHSVYVIKTYANVELILELMEYADDKWQICGDLKVIPLLMGMQLGYTKYCFLSWRTSFIRINWERTPFGYAIVRITENLMRSRQYMKPNTIRILKIITCGKRTWKKKAKTATAGSDAVQSGRPIFDDFFQHLWPYIGNNTANVVFQMVKRLWLIRIDQ
ncbi:uncharacterized protein TNCV_4459261 [Trichonephila clavipes]|nr:uncharacterized protein TNCV_4459261 [Trichonephila clavipes]